MKIELSQQDIINILNFVISLIALVYTFFQSYIQNPRIKIGFKSNWRSTDNYSKPLIIIDVINKGTRPINISGVAICELNSNGITESAFLWEWRIPVTLTIESPKKEYIIPEEGIDLKKIWYIEVEDVYGKTHKKYINKRHYFSQRIQKIKSFFISLV